MNASAALSAYLPADRCQALAADSTLPDRVQGAALCADVSGFTLLTDALTQALGPRRGAEALSRELNAVFTVLTAVIDRYGGSVIGFAGDALTAWFDARAGQATWRAVACAAALQAAARTLAPVSLPAGATLSFALKVGVASGRARRLVVGDPAIQLFDVLAGATLARLAAALSCAERGQVMLDAASVDALVEQRAGECGAWVSLTGAAERFAPLGRLHAEPELAAVPPLPELAPERVRAWLLPAVYTRLTGGLGEFLAEMRRTTVLFLHFAGIDYDADDAAGAQLDRYVRDVQGVLARYDGALLGVVLGDKGNYLYAAFGALSAHEDDARRAVAAALALCAPVTDARGTLTAAQAGLGQGLLLTGAYGGLTRRTYGVLGDEVNLAARLMEAAPPGVALVSARAHQAAGSAFVWEPQAPLSLKGKAEPALAFRPVAEQKKSVRASAPLVGREAECATLDARLAELVAGRSGLVVIEGDPGIGKSRLIEEFEQMAAAQGVGVWTGAADAVERTSYHAWRTVYAQALELEGAPEAQAARVAAVLADLPDYALLAPLLNPLMSFSLPDTELTAQMRGTVRADNTRGLLLALLQNALGQRPHALVLDDAQWLDSASWALALATAHTLEPLLLVIVTRPLTTPTAEYRELLQDAYVTHIRLQNLAAQAALALVCQRLGIAALPPEVAALIQEKAEGHPFFSEELAYALRDAGYLQVEAGQARLAPGVDLRALAFPDTVQGVILSRIDHLTPSEQLTLKVASVVGRVFALRILSEIYPVTGDQLRLPAYLDTLQKLDLTPLEQPDPERAYFFKHIITQQVAYDLLLSEQRRALHQSAAEWHERQHSADLAPFYPLLAYHWSQAEVHARALAYLDLAATQSLRSGAYREAVGYLREALAQGGAQADADVAQKAHWQRGLGEAYWGLGELAESRRALEISAAWLGRPVPRGRGAFVVQLLGQVLRQMAHLAWPARFVAQTDAGASQAQWLELAHIYSLLSELAYFGDERVQFVYGALRTLNFAERAGPSPLLATTYADLTVVAGAVRQYGLAEHYVRAAHKNLREDDLPAHTRVLTRLGVYHVSRAEWDAAEVELAEAREVCLRLDARRQAGETLTIMGHMAYYRGQFARSRDLFAETLLLGERAANILHIAWGLSGRGRAEVHLGQFAEGIALLEASLARYAHNADRISPFNSQARIALALWRRGDAAEARLRLQGAVEFLGTRVQSAFTVLDGYASVAEVALGLVQVGDATQLAYARLACGWLVRYARTFPLGRARAALWQGVYAWQTGRAAQAQAHWQTALREAERLALPYEAAQVRLWQARAGDHAQAPLALAGFTPLGAAYEMEQARALVDA